MKRGTRFSASMVRRWEREGRGLGILGKYKPWHQVRRADPGSRGRSHLLYSPLCERMLHLLSDTEKLALALGHQLADLFDVLEQFPLHPDSHSPLADRYTTANDPCRFCAGTVALAKTTGIRHPAIRAAGNDADPPIWRLTTDLVFVIRRPRLRMLAVAVKTDIPKPERSLNLLRLEAQYWQAEDVKWMLFCRSQVPLQVRLNIMALAPWVVSSAKASRQEMDAATGVLEGYGEFPLEWAVRAISRRLKVSTLRAQTIFWQTVWSARIPLDLERDLFRGQPLCRVTSPVFRSYNPIIREASAWAC